MEKGKKGKKPGGLAIIIASKMKGKENKEEKGEDKHTEMAKEMLEAIKAEGAGALGKVLRNFVKVCSSEE